MKTLKILPAAVLCCSLSLGYIQADQPSQVAYTKAINPSSGDEFGHSVAVSGDTLVVGAPLEDSTGTGANPSNQGDAGTNVGAVYVYVRKGAEWKFQAYLKPSNTGPSMLFGWSVAIEGDVLVVGAPGESSGSNGINGNQDQTSNSKFASGAAYVFKRNGTLWAQSHYLKASTSDFGDLFGTSVAISLGRIAVGAPGEDSSATGVNGDQTNNDTFGSGAVYVFAPTVTGNLVQQAYLKGSAFTANRVSEDLGRAVALSNYTLVVGAPAEQATPIGTGRAYVYQYSTSTKKWALQSTLTPDVPEPGDAFGCSVAVSGSLAVVGARMEDGGEGGVNGDQTSNTAEQAGAAYVFQRTGTTWAQTTYLKPNNPFPGYQFGMSVAISGNNRILVGSPLEASSANGVGGDELSIGAANSGAAFLFDLFGSEWKQTSYLKASNTESDDWFGWSVALNPSIVAVGAKQEDSNSSTINGSQGNAVSGTNFGAAYVYSAGPVLSSLAKTGAAAPGGLNANFTAFADACVNEDGQCAFTADLKTNSVPSNTFAAAFSSLAGFSQEADLILAGGANVGGFAGLPSDASVNSVIAGGSAVYDNWITNQSGKGIFRFVTAKTSLEVLCLDNGQFLSPIIKEGDVIPGDLAKLGYMGEVFQSHDQDLFAVVAKRKLDTPLNITTANDSSVLLFNHASAIQGGQPREGGLAYGGTLGNFGEMQSEVALASGTRAVFRNFTTGGKHGVFFTEADGSATGKIVAAGDSVPGAAPGEKFGFFIKAPASAGGPVFFWAETSASRSGIWDDSLTPRVLKGDPIGSGMPNHVISDFLQYWVTGGDQLVVLSKTKAGRRYGSALTLEQESAGGRLLLMATGTPAPGIPGANVSSILKVDVNPTSGRYVILASLTGEVTPNNNLALWTGHTLAGDPELAPEERLPRPVLRKGDVYSTSATTLGTIRSISIPAAKGSTSLAAGGNGKKQVVGAEGDVVVIIENGRASQELVLLKP